MRPGLSCTAAIAVASMLAAIPAAADPAEGSSDTSRAAPRADGNAKPGSRWVATLVPRGDLFPPYVADPHRPMFAFQVMHVSASDVPDSGASRFGLKLGSRFGVVRFHPEGRPDRGVQVGLDAGFIGFFDRDRSTDNIGWEGLYGLTVTIKPWDRTAILVGTHHTSSHLGDEYAERTGRRRIDYTREELVLGVSRTFGRAWRVYADGGWAYGRRNEELQEEGRARAGAEVEGARRFWKGRLGWYGAVDVNAYEESDWARDVAIQAGVFLRDRERTWRLGLEHYDGRSLVGELFSFDETYTALSLWLEL